MLSRTFSISSAVVLPRPNFFWSSGTGPSAGLKLSCRSSVVQAHACEHFVCGREADRVDGHVGGGVVTEGHHQSDDILESEVEAGIHQVEDAGAADLIFPGQDDGLREIELASSYLFEGLEH